MKIAIITDTHFGGRRGSKAFHEFWQKFYDDIFFPELEKRGIKECIHMGDAFDNRKNIDYWSLDWAKEHVYDRFKNLGVKVWQLVGNHDVYYKNTNKINSVDSLLRSYDNLIPISEPGEYDINGFKAFMLPWICDENYQLTQSTIAATNAKVAFGHLELQGFQLYPGCVQQRGIDKGIIEKFDTVFSGHYHTRSNDGQTFYLGNPYEMYWNDCGDKRGFNILDTDDMTMEFIENPYHIFEKVYYEDTPAAAFPAHRYKDKIVKLFVRKKTSQLQYQKFVDRLLDSGVQDLKIIESMEVNDEEVEFDAEKVEDTLTLLNKYIEDSDFELKKDRVKELLKEVYMEACEMI
jgi:DNA repair exonuclease SbcCD nuclease subunit